MVQNIHRRGEVVKLSIIIPVYNEKDTILKVIDKVKTLPLDKEIIVVDDGSTDRTREILKTVESNRIKIILKECNEGKGAAIRKGLEYAEGDYVVFQDADLELEPHDILHMVKMINDNSGVIYGSRFLKKQKIPFINLFANKFLTLLTNILFSAHITDMETCYKLCPRDLLLSLNLQSNSFEIEPEITCKILKRGIKIKEVPVTYNPRRAGKKINWRDGVKAIFYLLKYRITG